MQKERKYILHGKIDDQKEQDHVFKPKDSFPSTRVLPTGKDLIESLIFFSHFREQLQQRRLPMK